MNENPPRILHVINDLSTGGAEKKLYNLLRHGFAERFSCHVISLSDEGTIGPQIETIGVPVTALGISRGWQTLSGMIKLYRLVKSFKPDLIQGWMYHGNLAATLACAFAPKKTVLAWNIRHSLYDLRHENILTRQVIRVNRFCSRGPSLILYNSRLSRSQHEAFGFAADNGLVIPNGIDTSRFVFSAAARQRIRAELGIPIHALVVGHVARLHPMKDHSLFLKAAVHLAMKHPDLHFVLSGRGVERHNKTLSGFIPGEFVNRFHLLGERGDIPALMSAMDVFSSSSYGEGWPNVIGEAMAVRLPCVATDVGDSALIVGDTGVIVPPYDEQIFSAGIEWLLSLSYEERCLLGARARTRIEKNYRLDIIIEQYTELYEQLVKKERQ